MSPAEFGSRLAQQPRQKFGDGTGVVSGTVRHLAILCIASLIAVFAGTACADEYDDRDIAPLNTVLSSDDTSAIATTAFDPASLPSIDSIDGHTDITVFLGNDVPVALHVAALRRVWRMNPVIRDFKGLNENDWDFERTNGAPGFGEIGPELDVRQMVARILGEPARLASANVTSFRRHP